MRKVRLKPSQIGVLPKLHTINRYAYIKINVGDEHRDGSGTLSVRIHPSEKQLRDEGSLWGRTEHILKPQGLLTNRVVERSGERVVPSVDSRWIIFVLKTISSRL